MSKRIYATSGQVMVVKQRRYGFWNFCLDLFMTFFTAGLWLIWVIIREIKNS